MLTMTQFFHSFWNILLATAPFFLLGLLFAGILHVLSPLDRVLNLMKTGKWSDVFWASVIGVPVPLCSCSVLPTAISLKQKKASNAAVSSFLISTPESGIDSMAMTYALMDWPMTFFRPLAAFLSAFMAGTLNYFWNKDEKTSFVKVSDEKDCCAHEHGHEHHEHHHSEKKSKLKESLSYSFGSLVDDLSLWMITGLLLGAMIEMMIPQDFFSSANHVYDKLIIILVGVPFYVCASGSTPIAVSMMMKGLSPGSALLFLLVGPATNVANIVVVSKYLGKRGVVFNLISIVTVGLLFSFFVDWFYLDYLGHLPALHLEEHHHNGYKWWESLSAVAMLLLLFKGIYVENISPRLKLLKSRGH